MIESIENMRNTVKTIAADCDEPWILGCLDDIETEINEQYIKLPLDADGVPIHVGDYLQLGNTRGDVVALTYCPTNGKLPWEFQCDTGDWYNTAFTRHAKPRTLDDALEEFANLPERIIAAIDRYANEIRELLAGDAE